jgi:serine/threonine protein kinase
VDKAKIINDEVRLVESDDEPSLDGLRVGATIDEFVIESLLGRGGVSEVYRARDTRTNSEVALKFLLPSRLDDKQSCARLRSEAMHIMDLRHRYIVSVLDVREDPSAGPFIVMELVDGKPLGEQLPMSEAEALRLCAQISEGLAYAHGRGMIHRDIKPSNVMLLEDGSIRIVDFGLAKVFAPEKAEHIPLTRTSEVVGTPLYMSPEQCFGQSVDARSDVYQLGCLLFQCITGFPPFEGSNSFEAMYKHVSAQPKLDAMSLPVQDVLKKALDKNMELRFQSMSEMGEALRIAMSGTQHAASAQASSRGRFCAGGSDRTCTGILHDQRGAVRISNSYFAWSVDSAADNGAAVLSRRA